MQDIAHSEDNFEQVYLVGFRLWPDSHHPDVYTMVLYNEVARGDANRPLTRRGSILFSRDKEGAARLLVQGDPAFRKYAPFTGEVAYIYDVPAVLDTVRHADQDDAGIVADFVNELLDFVAATPFVLPSAYNEALRALADSTTFDKNLRGLFQTPSTRNDTLDALLWAFGAVGASSALE